MRKSISFYALIVLLVIPSIWIYTLSQFADRKITDLGGGALQKNNTSLRFRLSSGEFGLFVMFSYDYNEGMLNTDPFIVLDPIGKVRETLWEGVLPK